MKVWFKVSELRSRVGIITDYYGDYMELKNIETGEYHIVHKGKVELIKIR